ncbi:MAG TPA: GNAT family N-acetyltransferase [Actinomycetota bacterium]
MSEIFVRRANSGDLPAVERLWRELQAIQGDFRVLKVTRDLDAHVRDEFLNAAGRADALWLVAEAGGRVVAMAFLHAEKPSRVSDEEVLEMSRVAVDPVWRGRGVGRALVAEAERIARERGARYLAARVFSRNEEAVRFWDAIGFESFVDTRLRPVDESS